MKTKFLPITATIFTLFFFPKTNVAQLPDLGSAANFVLFTSNGAVTNTGVSEIAGDIGTNSGLITGFGTSSVTGSFYNADSVTEKCSTDLLAAYDQLYAATVTSTHIATLGNGETLNAGVYSIAAAGSLVSILTLDAQGDSNAVFIFKIGAAFTTAASSAVSLVKGTSANNVFWIVEGAVAMGASTAMKGTLISHNAAISIGAGSSLTGRMFSTAGDVTLDALSASVFPLPAVIFEQAPNLGSLNSFVLFTTTGAMDNTGVSMITGNIGDNEGSITGFGVGNLIGNIYNADAVTAKGSTDLMDAYNQLMTTATTSTHSPVLGNGETIYPGVFSLAAAGSIASVLTLDAQGDDNAVFIFKVGGAFSTAASSTVNLVGGASACNVFWVAEGAISMASSTTMKGTLISHNGAVSMGAGGSLEGRMFSTTGAVSVYSVSASLPSGCSVSTSWTGAAGTSDWYTPGNWTRFVPDEFVETLIPTTLLAGRVFPILDSGIAAVDTITIQNAAAVTVTNSTLQINGAIINNGTFNATNGTIEMTSFSGQTIAANTFQDNALNNLIISNRSAAGVILGGVLDIYGSLTYSDTSMKLITNDGLTLKSTASNSARIGDMTGNTITGKVTVERYIPAHKAWQYLSIPTNTTQTIQQSWQEGATSNVSNLSPGFGTQITGAAGTVAGFDLYTALPSMKSYNSTSDAWVGVPNTNAIGLNAANGYMVFIRGDRSSNAFNSPVTATVLRSKGDLYIGDQNPVVVNAGVFTSIGNPYVSAVDMRGIDKTGVKDFFYVWDPKLGGNYGYGAYQLFSNEDGNYVVVPGGGSYGAGGSVSNYMQSGLAFLVQGNVGGGSLVFKESAKSSGSHQISIAQVLPKPQLLINLFGVNMDSSTYMADGLLINYDDSYSNKVDDMDAIKIANSSENLAVKTGNTLLIVDRRHTIMKADTVFLNLKNLKMQTYRLEFNATRLNETGITGILKDNYLHTSTSINAGGSTVISFTVVNVPASYAADRFSIVFTPAGTLPVTFASVKAYFEGTNVNVEWKVENESNMKEYDVERSANGNDYTITNTVIAKNEVSVDYDWLDVHPSRGYNYYRVKSTDVNGKTVYSGVVKVFVGKEERSISVYPNPITNGIINMQMNNERGGNYEIRLLNKMGQDIISKSIHHCEGSGIEKINVPGLARGTYLLVVTNPDGSQCSNNIIY